MQIIKVHHDQWSYHFFKVSDWSPHICDSVHTQRTELCCFPVIKPTWHNQNKESTDEEESRKETKTKTKAGSAMWREHQQSCRRNSCYGNAGTAIGSWRLQVQIQRNFSKGQLINISEETGCDENDNVPGQVMLTKKKKKLLLSLAGVAQGIECRPQTKGSQVRVPDQRTCLGCEPGPQ